MHTYSQTSPILSKLDTSKKLIFYLSVSDEAIKAVLVQEERSELRPMYFVSRVLQDPEMRYRLMEKVAFALVNTTFHLRQYFQCPKITTRTNCHIAKILHKPKLLGQMMGWSIKLSKYEIAYELRGTIRAHVLADFNELHPLLPQFKHEWWTMHVDGSSNWHGSGTSVILEGPNDVTMA